VNFLISVLAVVLVGVVIFVVGAPLRAASRAQLEAFESGSPAEADDGEATERLRRDELDAAREAKYREIRDAELDYRTGKLSREDYETIDGDLRAEAIEILDHLEASGAERPPAPGLSNALEQEDGVQEEQHREHDRPAV
jgi:hypothetical protein